MLSASKIKIPLMLIALVLAAFVQAKPAAAVEFTERQIEKLKAGKSVKKPLSGVGEGGVYGGSGFALIDAPPEVVWRAILDWSSYHTVYPRTVEARELSQRSNRSLVRVEMGYQLLSVQFFVEIRADKSKWQLDFTLVEDKPNDIEAARGYWRLFPQPNGQTLVAYVTAVKVPMGVVNLIPESLEKKINRNLLACPQYLREWIHSPAGSRYRAARL
jgi:hypothetical protein